MQDAGPISTNPGCWLRRGVSGSPPLPPPAAAPSTIPAAAPHPPTRLRKGIFGTDPVHLDQRCCAEAQNSPCTAAAAGLRRAKTPRNTQAPGASQPVQCAHARRAAAPGPALAQILPSQKATPALPAGLSAEAEHKSPAAV